jgi:hypothetical protein
MAVCLHIEYVWFKPAEVGNRRLPDTGGSLELGIDQIVFDNSVADTIGFYRDTIQLVNYEGRPLTGLTFDLKSRGKVIMTSLTFDSTFHSDH